jgi:hypothetical protein
MMIMAFMISTPELLFMTTVAGVGISMLLMPMSFILFAVDVILMTTMAGVGIFAIPVVVVPYLLRGPGM